MKQRLLSEALWVGALLLIPTTAHAQYLDPGASSVVVQLVIAGLIGSAAVLKLYWNRLKGFISSSRKPSSVGQDDPPTR